MMVNTEKNLVLAIYSYHFFGYKIWLMMVNDGNDGEYGLAMVKIWINHIRISMNMGWLMMVNDG